MQNIRRALKNPSLIADNPIYLKARSCPVQSELRLAHWDRSLMTAKRQAFIDYTTSYSQSRDARVRPAQQRQETLPATVSQLTHPA
jgi:hypothetical protein